MKFTSILITGVEKVTAFVGAPSIIKDPFQILPVDDCFLALSEKQISYVFLYDE